jgi:ADP-ribose pyrophosphatase YjhB (NUDIX family)
MIERRTCPDCGHVTEHYKNPYPTADVIVDIGGKVLLIRRKNPPAGWAIPGGFIDYGECAEDAARREILEETGIEVRDLALFGVFSDPSRDPRFHTLTVVYTGVSDGVPVAGDDAAETGLFSENDLPKDLAFDHADVLAAYFAQCRGQRPIVV